MIVQLMERDLPEFAAEYRDYFNEDGGCWTTERAYRRQRHKAVLFNFNLNSLN